MTDHEIRHAIAAVAWVIRHHGDDPDVAAGKCVTMLRHRGWRHVPTLTPPADTRASTPPPPEWRQARAAVDAVRHRATEEATRE